MDTLLIVVIIILGVLGLGIILWAFYQRRPQNTAPTDFYASDSYKFYSDLTPPSQQTPLPTPKSFPEPPSDTENTIVDETILGEEAMQARTPREDAGVTDLLANSDFRRLRDAGKAVIGWLVLEGSPPQYFEIPNTGAIIGRRRTCDIVLKQDTRISGEHASIELVNGAPQIRVLSKTNPIMLSGMLIAPELSAPLKAQDIIQLSPSVRLVFIQQAQKPDDMTTLEID